MVDLSRQVWFLDFSDVMVVLSELSCSLKILRFTSWYLNPCTHQLYEMQALGRSDYLAHMVFKTFLEKISFEVFGLISTHLANCQWLKHHPHDTENLFTGVMCKP